jgi:hypothetical protein
MRRRERPTPAQRLILALIRREGRRLGSYCSPFGRWHLSAFGLPRIVVAARTVRSMHRRGLIGGNVHWPYVTAWGWENAGAGPGAGGARS